MKTHITIASLLALGLAAAPAYAAPEVKTKGGFEIKDGDFSFKFGGRVMLDYVEPGQDVTPMGANLFFRRARLELEGKMFKDWEYKVEYDFAENAVVAKDLYATYTAFENQDILIGQFKQPWSLEELSSSKQLAFMERSLMNSAWSTAHRIGVGGRMYGDNYSLTASVYGKETGVTNATDTLGTPSTADDIPRDEPINVGARFVWAPIKGDDSLLHLAVAYAQEQVEPSAGLRLRARPEARPTNGDTRLIDTSNMADATGMTKMGVEAAWMSGGLSVQGEYQIVDVDSVLERDPSFSGYYVEARWFPSGEVRPYKMSTGAFSMIKPLNIEGAWEFRLRMSSLDLTDTCMSAVVIGSQPASCQAAGPIAASPVNAQAGKEGNISVGVTYYPSANVRYMLEYIQADVESDSATLGETESPNFIQARFQLSW